MPDTLVLLQLDHHKMAKLLDVIDQQATNMVRGGPVSYPLLVSAFAYLAGYPNQCHHPKEDLVYRKLRSRHPDVASSLEDLVEEHERLGQLTENLSRAIGESQPDPAAVNGGFADRLREFLDFYRRHMLMEEQRFFPAALQTLSLDDWAEIDFALFDQSDPLFDRQAEGRFAELRDEITRLAVAENARTGNIEEAALLATLRDIAAFNEAMQRAREPLCLVRSSEAGYELLRNGSVLAHIPECGETRAAWCAYFFWKATVRAINPLPLRD
jgi:hemerythrin-like domain-containing protein